MRAQRAACFCWHHPTCATRLAHRAARQVILLRENGRAKFQVEYSQGNPKWVMPSSYYTFIQTMEDGHTIQFFALDTEPFFDKNKYDPGQLVWLERELQNSRATWKKDAVKEEPYSLAPVIDNCIRFGKEGKKDGGKKARWWRFWRE